MGEEIHAEPLIHRENRVVAREIWSKKKAEKFMT